MRFKPDQTRRGSFDVLNDRASQRAISELIFKETEIYNNIMDIGIFELISAK